MAMVRKMKNSSLTFTEFADQLLKFALSSNSHSPKIDIVFDVYRKSSIKNAERNHRETGKLKFKKIIGCQVIKQWGSFLSSGENKKELLRFLVSRWEKNCDVIGDLDVYVTFDGSCIKLGSNGHLFICTGTQNKARTISIGTVKESLAMRFDVEDIERFCRALLVLHSFTGHTHR